MKRVQGLDNLPDGLRRGAVSIGNFDGVHQGHARIIDRLTRVAARVGGPAVVFTFEPHPVQLLRPQEAPAPLTWSARKAALLERLGVDAIVIYPTDRQLLRLVPEAFFQLVLVESLDAQAVVEGPNFFFGRHRAGNIQLLERLCSDSERSLEVVPPLLHEGEIVSSSRLRKLIAAGDVDTARRMLTQPYRIRGLVTHGAGRGAKIGFPTANLAAIETVLPAPGVYAGRAWVKDVPYAAAINIGPNPTFDEQRLKVEAHLLEFDDTLYETQLELEFLDRLREVRAFESVDQLQRQLKLDLVQVAETLAAQHEK